MRSTLMKLVAFIVAVCTSVAITNAQGILDDDQIQLPELTTTVSGDTVVAGKDAVPDFSKIVPDDGSGNSIMPKLPEKRDGSYYDSDDEPLADFTFGENKNIFVQGLIGGGYPGDFIGDFSVYKSSGANPFKIEFSHLSRNGYGKHSAGNGFFDNGTRLFAEKTVGVYSSDLTFRGTYEKTGTGLQDVSTVFYDTNSQKMDGGVEFSHVFGDSGLAFKTSFDSTWYNRYGGIIDKTYELSDIQENADIFYLKPKMGFTWAHDELSLSIDGGFQWENVAGPKNEMEIKKVCRGDGNVLVGFKNDFFTLFGSAGIAGGNEIGDKWAIPVFGAGVEVKGHMGTNENSFSIGLSGGLESGFETFYDLEKKFKYAQLESLTPETSDWYAKTNVVLPLTDTLILHAKGNYKKTAFGNGVWEADYGEISERGVYGFECLDRTLVSTEGGLSILVDPVTFYAGVKTHWMHVPSNEYRNVVRGSVSYDDDDEMWGATAGIAEAIDSGSDKCPIISSSLYFNIKDMMRISCELDDAIKLFTRKDRSFVDSEYLVRAGSVTLLARFFF